MRAVTACAAMPQARNATSTIAANGFVDHEPNELTTAVVTGSTSSPATTAAGSGCASVDRDRVEDHQRADAQQRDPDRARDVARGVLGLLGGADARSRSR